MEFLVVALIVLASGALIGLRAHRAMRAASRPAAACGGACACSCPGSKTCPEPTRDKQEGERS